MIVEFIEYLTTSCPPYARKTGYLKEAIAIRARYGRLREAWRPHLEQTQALIEEASRACDRHRKAVVLGSGLLLDIPLGALAASFERVLLVDLVHLRRARRLAARHRNVELVTEDITGLAPEFDFRVSAGWRGDPVPEPDLFLDDPSVDLVVSANVMAQLPIFPAAALQRRIGLDGDELDRFCQGIVEAHLAYLHKFEAVVCLITEIEREAFDKQGNSLQRHEALFGVELPDGAAYWDWDLAPLGEISRQHALRNRVAGFCDISAHPPAV